MAFNKAPRFCDEKTSCAPPPTAYNPKLPSRNANALNFNTMSGREMEIDTRCGRDGEFLIPVTPGRGSRKDLRGISRDKDGSDSRSRSNSVSRENRGRDRSESIDRDAATIQQLKQNLEQQQAHIASLSLEISQNQEIYARELELAQTRIQDLEETVFSKTAAMQNLELGSTQQKTEIASLELEISQKQTLILEKQNSIDGLDAILKMNAREHELAIHALQETVSSKTTTIQNLKSESKQHNTQIASLELEISQKQTLISEKQNSIDSLNAMLKINAKEHELAINALQEAISCNTATIQALELGSMQQKTQIASLELEISQKQTLISEKQISIDSLVAEKSKILKKNAKEHEVAQTTIAALQEGISSKMATIQNLELKSEQQKTQIASLEQEISQNQALLAEKQNVIASLNAEKFETLEIHSRDCELAQIKIQNLEETVSSKTAAIQNLELQLEQQKTEIASLAVEISQNQILILEEQNAIDSLNTEKSEILEIYTRERELAQAKVQDLEEIISSKTDVIQNLELESEQQKTKIASQELEISQNQAVIAEKQNVIVSLNAEKSDILEIHATERELAQTNIQELEEAISTKTATIQTLELESEQLKTKLASLELEISQNQAVLAEKQNAIDRVNAEKSDILEIHATERELAQTNIQELEEIISSKTVVIQNLESESEKQKTQIASLELKISQNQTLISEKQNAIDGLTAEKFEILEMNTKEHELAQTKIQDLEEIISCNSLTIQNLELESAQQKTEIASLALEISQNQIIIAEKQNTVDCLNAEKSEILEMNAKERELAQTKVQDLEETVSSKTAAMQSLEMESEKQKVQIASLEVEISQKQTLISERQNSIDSLIAEKSEILEMNARERGLAQTKIQDLEEIILSTTTTIQNLESQLEQQKTEIATLALEISQNQIIVAEKQNTIDILNAEKSEIIEVNAREHERAQTKIQDLEGIISSNTAVNKNLEMESEQLKTQIASLELEISQIQTLVLEKQISIDSLIAEKSKILEKNAKEYELDQTKIQDLGEIISSKTAAIQDLKFESEKQKIHIASLELEISQTQTLVSEKQNAIEVLSAENSEILTINEKHLEERDLAQKNIRSLEEQVKVMEEEAEFSAVTIKQLQLQLKSVPKECSNLKLEVAKLKSYVENLESENKRLMEEYSHLVGHANHRQKIQQVSNLMQKNADYKKENEDLRERLTKMRQKNLDLQKTLSRSGIATSGFDHSQAFKSKINEPYIPESGDARGSNSRETFVISKKPQPQSARVRQTVATVRPETTKQTLQGFAFEIDFEEAKENIPQ